jgi:hypothetical protein
LQGKLYPAKLKLKNNNEDLRPFFFKKKKNQTRENGKGGRTSKLQIRVFPLLILREERK